MLTWILTIALLVVDTHHYSRAMPPKLAQGIAKATACVPGSPAASACGPDTQRSETALLVVFAFHESSYRSDVRGDGGNSCGAFQTPCGRTPLCNSGSDQACFDRQAELALSIMHQSMLACPEFPLAVYAAGSCSSHAGRVISTARIAEAKVLLSTP